MSFARVSSVLQGLAATGATVGVGGVLGYFFYKKALQDITELVKESKDVICVPDTCVAFDENGDIITQFLDEDTSLVVEDGIPLEFVAKAEKYKKPAIIILRGSMMLVGLSLGIYVMAEKGADLYQFIESFDPSAAEQQVLSATVTGVALALLPAVGVSAGKPAAKLIEAGASKLSCYVNYARSFFKNAKEAKKDDNVEEHIELVSFSSQSGKRKNLNLPF